MIYGVDADGSAGSICCCCCWDPASTQELCSSGNNKHGVQSPRHRPVRPTSRHLLASCVAWCVKHVSLCCHRAVREQGVRRKREEEGKAPTLTLSCRCGRNDRYPPQPFTPHGLMIPSVTDTLGGIKGSEAALAMGGGGLFKSKWAEQINLKLLSGMSGFEQTRTTFHRG